MKLSIASLSLLALASCQSSGHEMIDYGDDPLSNPAFMEAAQAYSTPGAEHADMAKSVGSWKVDGKMFMAPGADAMPSTATADVRMILGGRYLIQEYKSDFMGMPFEGMMIMGFDNLSNEYFNMWFDTWSTGYSSSRGTEDDQGVIKLEGTMKDVMSPNGRPYRSSFSRKGDNEFTMKMYDTNADGEEWMVMELTYKRG